MWKTDNNKLEAISIRFFIVQINNNNGLGRDYMAKYVDLDLLELNGILQSGLLNRIGNKRIPNNSKGLTLLEKEANEICKKYFDTKKEGGIIDE